MAQKIFCNILAWALIALFPFFIVSLAVFAIAFDFEAFNSEFLALGVYDQFGKENAMQINKEVLSYLQGKTESLETGFFTEREVAHLADVRTIFQGLRMMMFFSIALFIIVMIFDNKRKVTMENILVKGSILLLALMALLLIAMAFNFASAFSSFHELLFPQGNYLFDPQKENIVNLYPQELFMHLAQKIALLSSILSLLLLFGGLCMRKQSTQVRNRKKQKGI